ncbi:MAG: radical SAM protein [Thermoplasmata archaeon]|nr:radical SAM protein [Thermoplasmata archaeon]
MSQHKVFIDSASWECLSNLASCAKISKYLTENGHKVVNNPHEADYIIINTCGVFKKSEELSLELYRKYKKMKMDKTRIIMLGCLVKINRELLEPLDAEKISFDEMHKLDEIFFNKVSIHDVQYGFSENTKTNLTLGKNVYDLRGTILFRPNTFLNHISKKFLLNYEAMMSDIEQHHKIFVEIVETGTGCAGNCSYCVIKKAKKKIQSKEPSTIINEIKPHYGGSKKILLIADDCGSYGIDKDLNLPALVEEIQRFYPDASISFNFLNPMWLQRQTKQYLKMFKNTKIDSIQLTLQSGSNKIIKRMNRHYDVDKVVQIIKKIRKISPQTFLYSHFIVGFPGETMTDFLKTLFTSIYFDANFIFQYEDRKGAESTSFPDKKPKSTIERRYLILLAFSRLVTLYTLLKRKHVSST